MRVLICITLCLVLLTGLSVAKEKWPTEGNPVPSKVSTDPTYGLTEKNPIRVGSGPEAERAYLSSLRGPHGETVQYERKGSCCSFKTPNAWVGGKALLDMYHVTFEGLAKPIVLYVDMYDYEQPLVPVGLTKAP